MMAPIKVIVVGGGPCGITAAHVLHQAGIDFVILERRHDVFADTGASLVLTPPNLRVFGQLGLLDKLLPHGAPFLHLSQSFNPASKVFKRTFALSRIQDNHGLPLIIFHRAVLLQTLFDALPDEAKARYLVNKKVTNIDVSSTGVTINCDDGSSYSAALVIGADGVHSKTREIIRQARLRQSTSAAQDATTPESIATEPGVDGAFSASYKCLWGSFDRETEIGESYEVQGHHRSAMYLTGKEKAWIFLYERLPEPTTKRVSFSPEEIAAFAKSFSDWQVHEKLKISDIISRPTFVSGMSNLQEGVAPTETWSQDGRIVLVGDACHRFTPNAGLGFNAGIQDIVSLTNRLHKLATRPNGTEFSDEEALKLALEGYQEERREPVARDYSAASQSTRLQAWATWRDYLLARWVYQFEFVKNFVTDHWTAAGFKTGRVLDFIKSEEVLQGAVPWDYPLGSISENKLNI